GPAETCPPTLPFHSCAPVRASSAKKYPSRPPANTRSDAVASTPLSVTSLILNCHFSSPVLASNAWIAPHPSCGVRVLTLPGPVRTAGTVIVGKRPTYWLPSLYSTGPLV